MRSKYHTLMCPRRRKETQLCEKCGEVIKHLSELKNHVCGSTKENNSNETEKHTAEELTIKEYALDFSHSSRLCDCCGKVFTKSLTEHLKTHQPKKRVCAHCNYQCFSIVDLRRHLGTHREEKLYLCELCGKGFPLPHGLKTHMLWHAKKKRKSQMVKRRHFCLYCDKTFLSYNVLKKHMCSHEMEGPGKLRPKAKKPNICPYCEKEFVCPSNLQVHICSHLRDVKQMPSSPYTSCSVCIRGFHQQKTLSGHIAWHKQLLRKKRSNKYLRGKGVLPYSCEQCSEAFSRISDLKRHNKAIHKLYQSYKCHLCGKVFPFKSTLKRHMTWHGERKHECKLCRKRYFDAYLLEDHVNTHMGEKPYVCATCNKSFCWRGNFKRHLAVCEK